MPYDRTIDAEQGAGAGADRSADVVAGADAGAGADANTGADAGADAGTDAGADVVEGADACADAGADACADAGADADADAGTDTNTKANRSTGALTQRDMARLLGVSIGTVDRAMHNRNGVSADMRERVMSLAAELGYSPNLFAQALGSNKNKRAITVVTPRQGMFWRDILAGVGRAAEKWKEYGLEIRYKDVLEGDIADELNAIESASDNLPNGLVCVPFSPHLMKGPIDKLTQSGVNVVTLNRDCPASSRLFYVGEDPYGYGALCARYYARFVRPGQKVVVLSIVNKNEQIRLRTEGFLETMSTEAPDICIEVKYYSDPDYEAGELARQSFASESGSGAGTGIGGVFLNTSTGLPGVAKEISHLGQAGKCFLMGIDITDTTLDLMDKKLIQFVVSQQPYLQGYRALNLLCEHIYRSSVPDKECHYVDFIVYTDRAHYESSQLEHY